LISTSSGPDKKLKRNPSIVFPIFKTSLLPVDISGTDNESLTFSQEVGRLAVLRRTL
jgi:hypothetical protein